jgi:hypothetical protein
MLNKAKNLKIRRIHVYNVRNNSYKKKLYTKTIKKLKKLANKSI